MPMANGRAAKKKCGEAKSGGKQIAGRRRREMPPTNIKRPAANPAKQQNICRQQQPPISLPVLLFCFRLLGQQASLVGLKCRLPEANGKPNRNQPNEMEKEVASMALFVPTCIVCAEANANLCCQWPPARRWLADVFLFLFCGLGQPPSRHYPPPPPPPPADAKSPRRVPMNGGGTKSHPSVHPPPIHYTISQMEFGCCHGGTDGGKM
jgi:hypothetical protein